MDGTQVFPGRPCPHCTGEGCGIYTHRPVDPCVIFNCAWVVEDSELPNWMRPDKSKAIVRLKKIAWRGTPVIYALPVGRTLPRRTLNWLKGFAKRTGRPLLYIQRSAENKNSIQESINSQVAFGVGPAEFEQQIAARRTDGFVVFKVQGEGEQTSPI
jgi:hypothetical protein